MLLQGFPYATCFVCKQQGHLSRDCDKNANGIYPDGGFFFLMMFCSDYTTPFSVYQILRSDSRMQNAKSVRWETQF